MSDLCWFIIIAAVFLTIGGIVIAIGLNIWKKEKINLLHSYHCDKVKEENKKSFCQITGIGTFIIGVGIALSGVLVIITGSLISFIPMCAALVTGLVMMVWAVIKYNR